MYRKLKSIKNIHIKISQRTQRVFFFTLFILGMFCIDRVIYFWGNTLAASPYWHSEMSNRLKHAERVDLLIVGGCRAALNFNPKIIEKNVNLKTFNAGKAAPGIGYMSELTLISGLAYQQPKYVAIVIDVHNLAESLERSRNVLVHITPWVFKLQSTEKQNFVKKYDLDRFYYKSGLYAFMGKGDELIRSTIKKFTKRSSFIEDGYEPRDVNINLEKILKNNSEYLKLKNQMIKDFSITEFSLNTYRHMIELIRENGAEPILVVAPMHALYASNDVNSKMLEVISDLSKKEAVQSFFYINNQSSIAKNNTLWSDTGHLNKLGAEDFSENFSKDFKSYINQSEYSSKTKVFS